MGHSRKAEDASRASLFSRKKRREVDVVYFSQGKREKETL